METPIRFVFQGSCFTHVGNLSYDWKTGYCFQWVIEDLGREIESRVGYAKDVNDFPLLDEFVSYKIYCRKQHGN